MIYPKHIADDDHVVQMATAVEDLWKKTQKNVGAMVTVWLWENDCV